MSVVDTSFVVVADGAGHITEETTMAESMTKLAMETSQINGNCKLVYLLLATDADDDGITPVLANSDIAERLGIAVSTVGTSLNRLRDLQFIVRLDHELGAGSVYEIGKGIA
jgi:DNA-binding MarR family transcriptional regulator